MDQEQAAEAARRFMSIIEQSIKRELDIATLVIEVQDGGELRKYSLRKSSLIEAIAGALSGPPEKDSTAPPPLPQRLETNVESRIQEEIRKAEKRVLSAVQAMIDLRLSDWPTPDCITLEQYTRMLKKEFTKS
jgi:hypothetical protein